MKLLKRNLEKPKKVLQYKSHAFGLINAAIPYVRDFITVHSLAPDIDDY
jgi:hypothetical protein